MLAPGLRICAPAPHSPTSAALQPTFHFVFAAMCAVPIVPTVEQAVTAASRGYPLPAGFRPSYGTAGFRALANLLDSTMFR